MKQLILTFLDKYQINYHFSGNEIKFRCPFHEERTPSFSINAITGKWGCFGCLVGGHSFESFIRRYTGKPIRLDEYFGEGDILKSKISNIYLDSISNISNYENELNFQQIMNVEFENFIPANENPMALEYLKKRKFEISTIVKYQLKFAINGNYKDRVIIPYYNGNTILGFNSRDITGHSDKRYLYNINRELFKPFLYGMEDIQNYVILVEGPFDLMWMKQCGYTNAISPLSTKLNIYQMDQIYHINKYIFCFDNDENKAGYNAMIKISEFILKMLPEKEIFYATLPEFKDPNECSIEELKITFKNLKRLKLVTASTLSNFV